MKRALLYLMACLLWSPLWAYKGHVVDKKGEPVVGATVSVLGTDSTMLQTAVTDSLGYYQLDVDAYPVTVKVQSVGYRPWTATLSEEPASTMETTLEEDQYQLKELVVTSDMIKQYDSHTSYRISQKEIANYSNFGLALNTIPFMTVTSKGEMLYRGNPEVLVLLNGVKTSWTEIQALGKEDVAKVDVYENPPAQYRLAGRARWSTSSPRAT